MVGHRLMIAIGSISPQAVEITQVALSACGTSGANKVFFKETSLFFLFFVHFFACVHKGKLVSSQVKANSVIQPG